jgi:2,3-bisphosphoglycerate-independent phosphoglycerate mutase
MNGTGKTVDSWMDAVKSAYEENESDEFIKPRIIDYSGAGKDDVFIFFNFRFDRTRQLTKAIVEDNFKEFQREKNNIYLLAMTHYYDNGNFKEVFGELKYKNILGEVISLKGLRQLRISETEKYAHVTFFFNALRNEPFENEDRILVNSPKVATYDLKPEMSANIVTKKLLEAIRSERYDLIVCNFANCDMVGHTGVYDKIVTAVETVDRCTDEVVQEILKSGGVAILTADHGNAEQTKLKDGSPMTSHTKNPVPLTIVGLDDNRVVLRKDGSLCDISPTILDIMDIKKPKDMSCSSLIEKI